jgi:hypothetical protein
MMNSPEVKEFFDTINNGLQKNLIRYAVQKQMFCPNTQEILDYRTCIYVEVLDGVKLIEGRVFSPSLVEKLDEINTLLTKRLSPSLTVKFTTINKKLKHPLLTKLK